jgi:hypothetical protein
MNHRDQENDPIGEHLRSAMPPWRDTELRRDLWPEMLRRMEDAPPRFGWVEMLLAGLIVLAFSVFPNLIPVLLYHL